MDRKSYWNENYYQYWKSRVEESKVEGKTSMVVEGDPKTEDDEVILGLLSKAPFLPGVVLEVGCAWGRLFTQYEESGLKIHGVDISQAMIDAAQEAHRGRKAVTGLHVAEAENLPFPSNSMDNLVCMAVFDATYQEEALAEFCRVLKEGGRLYFTGKHNHYHKDDKAAWDAEFGAARKGHPNFFTDVEKMLSQLKDQDFSLLNSFYFERRGDFGANLYRQETPDRYYEYLLILQKGSHHDDYKFQEFSREYSRNAQSLRKKA